jgi:hypothetical protein
LHKTRIRTGQNAHFAARSKRNETTKFFFLRWREAGAAVTRDLSLLKGPAALHT